jgi:hypothetical protein
MVEDHLNRCFIASQRTEELRCMSEGRSMSDSHVRRKERDC